MYLQLMYTTCRVAVYIMICSFASTSNQAMVAKIITEAKVHQVLSQTILFVVSHLYDPGHTFHNLIVLGQVSVIFGPFTRTVDGY